MRIALIHREKLQAIGSYLVSELDNLVSRIRTSWKIEHTEDGRHAQVNAETVSTGRLVFDDIVTDSISGTTVNNYDPDFGTASVLRINPTAGDVTLTGLKVPQGTDGAVLDGRVLVLENLAASGNVLILSHQDQRSFARNRFRLPYTETLGANATHQFYVRPGSLVVLVYHAPSARWRVVTQTNENSIAHVSFSTSQNDLTFDGLKTAFTCRLIPTDAALTISGLSSTGIPGTDRRIIVNDGEYVFYFKHADTGSSVGNRIYCPGGVRYALYPRESVVLQRADSGGWRIVLKADQWLDVTFAAGNFTATGGTTPTWTVASGDQITLIYQIDGNMMTVAFSIFTSSVSGGPTSLDILIPNGRTSSRYINNPIRVAQPTAGITIGFAEVTAGGTKIFCYSTVGSAAWDASTDGTYVIGEITFMVNDACANISESHTDVAHGDAAHGDADHADVTHIDVAHVDSHADVDHVDASHGDIAHEDVAHSDTHSDVAHDDTHDDVAHSDSHSDTAHDDTHADSHTDTHVDQHTDHDDGFHGDLHNDTHGDVAHEDSHGDTAHDDVAHSDVAHEDTHSDVAHDDTHGDTHSDVAHNDSAHSDVAHADSHSDTAHSDTAHVDAGHSDTAHGDTTHQDVGLHCDTTHVDM